jgi:hypothetical protein
MKNKKIILSVVLISLILVTPFYFIITNNINIFGWKDFQDDVKNNFIYVKSVSINRTLPIKTNIIFSVNKMPNSEEIDELFEFATDYILTERVFDDLVSYHKKKYDNSFIKIGIYIQYQEKGNQYDVEFMASQSEEGEPKPSFFKNWYIEYNHENSEFYKEISN